MNQTEWSEEDPAFLDFLTYEDGLREIEAFYADQNIPQDEVEQGQPLLGAEETEDDEFAGLMEVINQLPDGATAGPSHDATQAASNHQLHSLTGEFDANLQQDGAANPTLHTEELSSKADIHSEILQLQQGLAAPPNTTNFSLALSSTKNLREEDTQLTYLSDLPQTNAPSLDPSPMPDLKITRPKEDAHPPSSGDKNTLLDEMRGEERYSGQNSSLKAEDSLSEVRIHLPGIDEKATDGHSELANVGDQFEPDVPSSPVSVQTRLQAAASLTKKSLSVVIRRCGQPHEVKPSIEKSNEVPDQELFPDLPVKNDGEDVSTHRKRKKDAEDEENDLSQSDVTSNVSKRAKRRGKQFEHQAQDPTLEAEGTAKERASRFSLGQNEMKRLTESPFLAGEVDPHGKSGARQTRAQKQQEAKNAPNAGRAAKERHKKK